MLMTFVLFRRYQPLRCRLSQEAQSAHAYVNLHTGVRAHKMWKR